MQIEIPGRVQKEKETVDQEEESRTDTARVVIRTETHDMNRGKRELRRQTQEGEQGKRWLLLVLCMSNGD